jgi:tetratricopeptide (TPR) repeat protein
MDAGISGDEYLHLNQARMVLEYYKTFGQDQEALHTPVTNLKYYGQSFDNFSLLLAEIFNIEDIFTFRHIMSAIAGWFTLLFTILLAAEIAGWPTALFVLLLMSATPAFTGHALNNLKDIPFALGYVASLYFMIKWIPNRHQRPMGLWLGLIFSLAFLFSIRPGGLLAFAYLWAFTLFTLYLERQQRQPTQNLRRTLGELATITILAWLTGTLFWPYALENPLWHPIKSFLIMSDYPVTIRQLFEGKLQWSDLLPWYYLPKMMFLTLPIAIFPGVALFALLKPFRTGPFRMGTSLIATAALFPVFWIIVTKANVYGSWRHVLFVLPPLIIVSAMGLKRTFLLLNQKRNKPQSLYILGLAVLLLLLWHPLKFTIRYKPLHYLYFNQLGGGLKKAFGNYETDYYFHTTQPAANWLVQYLAKSGEKDVVLASNFETAWFFRNTDSVRKHLYTNYYNKENKDWDYGIFTAAYLYSATINQKSWPPKGTIYTIDIEGIPVCAVVKRPTKATFEARQAMESGQIESADSLLKVALKMDPKNENTWLQAGRLALETGRTDEALTKFQHTLSLLPNYEPALLNLALAQTKKGEWDEALAQLNKLLLKNPKYLQAYIEKANILLHQRDIEQAKETLMECLTFKPGYLPAIEKLKTIDYI